MSTRRRGAALDDSILESAWAEVQEHGYARLTMEGVAARAQTGKQVIYRRWPSRAQLVAAAIRHQFGALVPVVPDTGSLREDILSLLRQMVTRATVYTPDLLYGLLAEMPEHDRDFFATLPRLVATILRNAVAHGELKHADLPERVVSLPIDLLRYEGLRRQPGQMDSNDGQIEAALVQIVDNVFLPLVRTLGNT